VPSELWAREPDIPGKEEIKLGCNFRGLTINAATVIRQQNICNLYRLLKASTAPSGRSVFLEIGAGYGSFALDALRMLGDCCYVIVDIPETLIYSAVYLSVHRPDLRVYTYSPGDDLDAVLADITAFDIAFIPNYRAEALDALPYIDIGFNALSFPEMDNETARKYLSIVAPKLRRFFLSVNYCVGFARPTSAGTDELLAERFDVFPSRADYIQWVGSEAAYRNHEFRPTIVGVTPSCTPMGDVELRGVGREMGRLMVRKIDGSVTMAGERPQSAADPSSSPPKGFWKRLASSLKPSRR
jgi:hypothetical protein